MVNLEKLTTAAINALPTTGGRLVYDTDLNICKFRDGTGTAEFLNTDGNGSLNISAHDGATEGLRLGGVLVTKTAAELNATATNGTPGTVEASKTIVVDSSKDITGFNSLGATSLTGTLQTIAQTNITSLGTLTGLGINSETSDSIASFTSEKVGGYGAYMNILHSTYRIIFGLDGSGTGGTLGDILLSNWNQTGGIKFAKGSTELMKIEQDGDVNISLHNGSSIGLKLGGTLITSTAAELNILDGVTSTAAELNILDGVTSTAVELNYLDGSTEGTGVAGKALILNGSSNINSGIGNMTLSGALNAATLTGTLLTTAQPNIISLGTLTSLTTNGSVGINCTPSYQLDIQNTGSNCELRILRTDNNGMDFRLKSQNDKARITYEGSTGDLYFDRDNLGTLAMIMKGTGKIGINTSAPFHKLTVNGDIGLDDGNSIYFNRDITADDSNSRIYCNGTSNLTLESIRSSGNIIVNGNATSDKIFSVQQLGVEKFRIEDDGNISTTTTNSKCIKFERTTTGGGLYIEVTNEAGTRCLVGSDGANFYGGSTSDVIFSNWSDGGLHLITNATKKMTILSSGYLGIGTTSPDAKVEIKQSSNNGYGGLRLTASSTSTHWSMNVNTSNNFQFEYNDTDMGYISYNSGDDVFNFTGQHRNKTNNNNINNNIEDYIGLIVSSSGLYSNINNSPIQINDALPIVDLSIIEKDKKVFGVISDREDNNTDRVYQVGVFATNKQKIEGDERLFINGLGEGMVWICNINGLLDNGDLITTSTASGYGQLQSDDLFHNYTVAKITQDCDFSTPERYIDLSSNEIDQTTYDTNPSNGYKCCFVGCTYHCG